MKLAESYGQKVPIGIDSIHNRYHFNGKEADDEMKGEGNSYDFGARMYDSRLGRWLKTDEYAILYAYSSTYAYSLNTPIMASDENGDYVKVKITKYYRDGGSASARRWHSEGIKSRLTFPFLTSAFRVA